ncbi:MAG: enolase C-terminal domain-like protein [Planctomyces sp.]
MPIRRLTAFQVPIALRKPVRHASHLRTANETLIIRCELEDGSVGWGEGLPRPYVTGETIETVRSHLTNTDFSPLTRTHFRDPAQVVDALDSLQLAAVSGPPAANTQEQTGAQTEIILRECFGNSVRCALEIALLDAVCRSVGISIGEFLGSLPEFQSIVERRSEVFYSGAVTSMSASRQWISAWKMRLFAFRHVKVKVGAEGIDDRDCVKRVRGIVGADVILRLDANEAWRPEEVCRRMEPLLPFSIASLEQPVPHAMVSSLKAVREQLGVPVMLDESLCCMEDAERAITGQWCDLFNIRLSKCGGLIRSARLALKAIENGLSYQLGCQVGETGILSAAGRHFACTLTGYRFLEGSYDRFLVKDRLILEDITFRRGGRAPALSGPGLGVTVDEEHVRRIAEAEIELI